MPSISSRSLHLRFHGKIVNVKFGYLDHQCSDFYEFHLLVLMFVLSRSYSTLPNDCRSGYKCHLKNLLFMKVRSRIKLTYNKVISMHCQVDKSVLSGGVSLTNKKLASCLADNRFTPALFFIPFPLVSLTAKYLSPCKNRFVLEKWKKNTRIVIVVSKGQRTTSGWLVCIPSLNM